MRNVIAFLAGMTLALVAWFLRPSWDTLPRRPRAMWRYPQDERTPGPLRSWMKYKR